MPSADPRAAHLADPAVLDALRRAVRKIVRPADVDDVVQNAVVAALADPSYPEKREVFIPWLLTKGRARAIDHLRSTRRRENLIAEAPEGDVDALAAGPIGAGSAAHDAAEALRFAGARIDERAADPSTERGARWLLLHLRGEALEEIALAEGVKPKTVQRAVSRLKGRLRAAWITAAAAVLLFLFARSPTESARKPQALPEPAPSELPTVEPPAPLPPAPTPREFARRMREDAARECGAGQWERCSMDLHRAYEEDPEGNLDPGVQDLLKAANEHLPHRPEKPPWK